MYRAFMLCCEWPILCRVGRKTLTQSINQLVDNMKVDSINGFNAGLVRLQA